MLIILLAALPLFASPRNAALQTGSVYRAYIPEDADPCDFERFKADADLGAWVREISPNTATKARCYHQPAKILPVASRLLGDLQRKGVRLHKGAAVDPTAAALTGYQIDSVIEIERDGKTYLAALFKSAGNGPVFSQIYLAK